MVYQIRIKGHLGREWADWFDGLAITALDNGETLLTGPVVDQAALYGVVVATWDIHQEIGLFTSSVTMFFVD